MDRPFFEVFCNLKVDKDLESFLENASISKVVTNSNRDSMRVYMECQDLVPKRRIWKLEEEIKKQYFGCQNLEVNIIEKFRLSEQYNAEKLYENYKDSILEEIYQNSSVLFGLLKKADFQFVDGHTLEITLEDIFLAHQSEEEICLILYRIFQDRCGQDLSIRFSYKETEKSKYHEKSSKVIDNLVNSISKRYEESKNQGSEFMNDEEASDTSDKTVKRNTGKKAVKEPGKSSEAKNPYEKPRNSGREAAKDGFRQQRRFDRSTSLKRSSNPDVFYGRDIEGDLIPIEQIQDEMGDVIIRGKILDFEDKEFQEGAKSILMFNITDETDTIQIKIFVRREQKAELVPNLAPGNFIKVHGMVAMDNYSHEIAISSVRGMMKIPDFTEKRMDLAAEKRVELHCHTKMSDMDAVSNASDIIKQAMAWGHKAIAITDHGAVQAFPEAFHTVGSGSDFKVIYGIEAYLVDDEKTIVKDSHNQSIDDTYVVFDIETTGFSADRNKIIEIGAVKVERGEIVDRFSEFINPETPIPFRITELTSIRDDMVMSAPTVDVILPKFMEFSKGCIMVAHNADFDMSFIKKNCKDLGLPCNDTYLDTVELSKFLIPNLNNYKLQTVAKALNVSLEHHHRAVDDAECTAQFFVKEIEMLRDRGLTTLDLINDADEKDVEAIRKLHPNHCIILAKNDIGRINLYRLVSESHLVYYNRRPKMPKSLIRKYREGLILGSACSEGELYSAILNGRPEQEITKIASFYDFLEIQPVGNNQYMIESEDIAIASIEELQDINRRIVKLGETLNKLVCATCDVHFLNPKDEIYRRIIQTGNGFKDADHQPPLYLHTTEEMLEEFSYLGSDKAEEVVIKNTNKIADMCDFIEPVRPDKCPPQIENDAQMLRTICETRAHEIYGPVLPEPVAARLERELNSIIGNGYAVMYIIAQKLVWKSVEDGYLVGSRGSVGSSFVATMAGITEVNPLSAHYVCHHCHYSDFDSEEVKQYSGRAGADMPDKKCPVCGADLDKMGFDIPFETFLGFKGNKEPDIDLNFSGDYQAKAHRYTEVIFGAGQTFKAGTIGTLAEKTAYGYILKYFEEHGQHKRSAEINRIVGGCTGVRRTTGQHPGGIIVLPTGEEINTFTPVQHPANDMTSDVITTHFDYHSIDSNLLKLDILGHDDPTMIRMLEDLTGLDATTIPLDDKAVMSLFKNTDALGLHGEKLWKGTTMGTLGIPEFGTDFAMGLLKDAKPTEFSDLIRISGLSHGTDVWQGNAEVLIKEGIATISTAICCRDDIMVYLIHKGLDSEESFTIMERVRKGIVAKGKCKEWDQYKKDMEDHGVPDWYIESCKKIKYMFPKAHAAAYVMMAWRIAYCKVYYPLAYYAAYFSIRAKAFDYELMCLGREKLEYNMAALDKKRQTEKLANKEDDTYGDMRLVQEMYARGYEFLPMDVYQSDARYFKVVDGKLLPPLKTLAGMGESAAESLSIAAAQAKFLSKDDMRERGKVSKNTADKLVELKIVEDLPESNQLSLFDFQ